MSDTAAEIVNTVEAEAAATVDAKPVKEPKAPKLPHRCACGSFQVGTEEAGERSIETTECNGTTFRDFTQGHDARLVSFLVEAEFDQQTIWRQLDSATGSDLLVYEGAAHAAGSISQALHDKAVKALANRTARADTKRANEQARSKAKQDRDAAKTQAKAEAADAKAKAKTEKLAANPPKTVAAKVVEGSQEGNAVTPAPARDGLIKIKVGKGEYDAEVSEVDNGEGGTKKVVTYRNLRGEEETRDLDLVRVLA